MWEALLSMNRLRRTIVLVGLMGAGKTSVGKRLAELLDAPFYDSDIEIEAAAAGMSVPEIFERYGEPEFRRLERCVLQRLLNEPPIILATGGGAFVNPETRTTILEQGALSIWLSVDVDVLWARVSNKPGRPLLETENPKETLQKLFDARSPLYELADMTVHSNADDSQETVAEMVIAALTSADELREENKNG